MHFKLLQNGIKAKRKVIVFSIGTKYKYPCKAIRIVLFQVQITAKRIGLWHFKSNSHPFCSDILI
jgi:hypothetical protein